MRTIILLSCLGVALPAQAQLVHTWQVSNSNAHSTAAVTINGWTFYNVGNTVYGVTADNGTSIGSYVTGGTIDSYPQAVPLADGKWYVFVASQDGYLYKLDPQKGMSLAVSNGHDQLKYLGRATSCAADPDVLTATPSVMIKQYAGASYTRPEDLVIVPTHHGCGSRTTNMVYALDASDITAPAVWVFNSLNEYSMDYASEGCSLDYTRAYVYCGTNLDAGRYQNTVWAINLNTGNLVWAGNFNSVHARPQLSFASPGHLYVADYLGRIHAINPDDGSEDWNVVLSDVPGIFVTQNVWSEFRGDWAGTLFVTDSAGTLYNIYDDGAYDGGGELLWASTLPSGAKITSLGSVSPTLGKVYVGTDRGSVHQLNLATGADEGYHAVNGTVEAVGNTVTDPTLFVPKGAADISQMVATAWGTSGGTTRAFSVPFADTVGYAPLTCTDSAECKAFDAGQCGKGTCSYDPKTPGVPGYCYTKPLDGTACTDGNDKCTSNDTCVRGQCVGNWICTPNPQDCATDKRACGTGYVCYTPDARKSWQCVNVTNGQSPTPGQPCGSLSRTCDNSTTTGSDTWGGDRICSRGVCRRKVNNYCSMPVPTDFDSKDQFGNPDLAYASGINFARFPSSELTRPGVCTAFLTTFEDNSKLNTNYIRKVLAGGQSTGFRTIGGSTQPGYMHGVALVLDAARTVVAGVYTNFLNPAAFAHIDGKNDVTPVSTLEIPPKTVLCPGGLGNCAYQYKAFNQGPTGPVWNAQGRIYVGNYQSNGDLVYIDPQFGVTAAFNGSPPWCITSGCTSPEDRITAMDYPVPEITTGGPDLSDHLLRIGHGAKLEFYDADKDKAIRYSLDFRSTLPPGANKGGVPWLPANSIAWVISVTADPLNGTNDTYVELRDASGKNFVVQVRGDDHSVHPLANYTDTAGKLHHGVLGEMGVLSSGWPATAYDQDGRLTAGAQGFLYRLQPIDPATQVSNPVATITRFLPVP